MGSEESGERLIEERGSGSSNLNSVVSDKVSGVTMLYGCNWDPIMSLSQSGNFGNSNMGEFGNPLMLENQFPSASGVVDLVPSFASEMVSYNNSESGCNLMLGGVSPSPSPSPSPYGKRKREAPPPPKDAEEEEQKKNPTSEFISKEEDDEIKQKNGRGKQVGKQAKDNSSPSKDDYIHVRAKRGQATNSHSLAERVRRERISERMRLLQELVPGCNKITGKAMMLDEIINYVQSLQQQVEFLSMKLATVNPELNMDLDRILSKDILHLRGSNVGINPGFPGYPQGTFNSGPTTSTPFYSLPQHIWNNELQGLLQMGFDPDPSATMGTNGLSKMEL